MNHVEWGYVESCLVRVWLSPIIPLFPCRGIRAQRRRGRRLTGGKCILHRSQTLTKPLLYAGGNQAQRRRSRKRPQRVRTFWKRGSFWNSAIKAASHTPSATAGSLTTYQGIPMQRMVRLPLYGHRVSVGFTEKSNP